MRIDRNRSSTSNRKRNRDNGEINRAGTLRTLVPADPQEGEAEAGVEGDNERGNNGYVAAITKHTKYAKTWAFPSRLSNEFLVFFVYFVCFVVNNYQYRYIHDWQPEWGCQLSEYC